MIKLCKSLQTSMTTTDKIWSEKLVWVSGSGGLKLMHSKASINLQEKGLGGVWWNNNDVAAIFQTKHTQCLPELFFMLSIFLPAKETVSNQNSLQVHHSLLAASLQHRDILSPARQGRRQDLVANAGMDFFSIMNLMLPTRLPDYKCISVTCKN